MEPGQPVQMIIYQSNTYGRDLKWLHFDDEPKVQEQVRDQQSHISVSVDYLTYESNN